jgi:hypothetical protein
MKTPLMARQQHTAWLLSFTSEVQSTILQLEFHDQITRDLMYQNMMSAPLQFSMSLRKGRSQPELLIQP